MVAVVEHDGQQPMFKRRVVLRALCDGAMPEPTVPLTVEFVGWLGVQSPAQLAEDLRSRSFVSEALTLLAGARSPRPSEPAMASSAFRRPDARTAR
jgi:hypothetical protein